ncbi:MAG: aldose epimerase [Marivirga sp.]|nr:aldose epimerase [Marivirga sp.]
MNIVIENDDLIARIKSKGAELFSVVNKKTNLEYMWSGDPQFWGKTSPVLFPIVGTLKDNTFRFGNKNYNLDRHGFARDMEFDVTESQGDSVVFTLKSTVFLKEKYPFDFQLSLKYSVKENFLHVSYLVQNTGPHTMYFSIGGHPAFKAPLVTGTTYEDHYLEFSKMENTPRWPISPGGLIESNPTALLVNMNRIKLTKTLFQQDALVLKHLQSDIVSLKSTAHDHGLDFHFEGFPFLGIWAAKNADFVCIEPWCGIADSVTHNQELTSKEGIETLNTKETWSRTWKTRFY